MCIIDAPPARGQVLAALLAASDAVISPMSIDLFSIDGVANLLETITKIRDAENPTLIQLGIVPNQVNTRSKYEMNTLADLRSAYGALITPYSFSLRYAVKAAISARKPVWRAASGSSHRKAAQEWKDNCRTVLEQLNVQAVATAATGFSVLYFPFSETAPEEKPGYSDFLCLFLTGTTCFRLRFNPK